MDNVDSTSRTHSQTITFCPCPQAPPQSRPPWLLSPGSITIAGQLVYLPTPAPYSHCPHWGPQAHVIWPLLTALTTSLPASAPLTHCPFFSSWKTPSSLPPEGACARYSRPLECPSPGLCTADSGPSVDGHVSEMPPWPPSCPPHPQVTHAFHTLYDPSLYESLYFADLFAYLFMASSPGTLG